jgi:dihydrofolate reductase
VVVCELLSLDGVAEAPNLFFTEWDDAADAAGADRISTQDTVILGRRSYDEWVGFWPGSEIEPFASFIDTIPKHVARSEA